MAIMIWSKYVPKNYNHNNQSRHTGHDINLSVYRTLKKRYGKKINLYEPTFKNDLKTEKYTRKKS